jgi:anti-sigma regulatory factor (Ser/Thr protein kinase)
LRSGVVSVDPEDPGLRSPVPPVSIVRAIADGKTFETANAKLGARTKNLEIDYSAVSLNRANRVRFRYKLEGVDAAWRDAGSRRQAFYNNVPPGKYRFVVSASNGDNLWNEAGATMNVEVPPAFYQTSWFRVLCVVAFFALLWTLYRYRLYQIHHEFDARLEARVGERTRIARELHDTLLQSFQGHLFHLQAVFETLPAHQAGKQILGRAIDRAEQAIGEGRDAVLDLRLSATVTNDLALALSGLGQELADDKTNPNPSAPVFRIEVQGAPRNLHEVAREEVYRIAAEALRNAFWHANAQHVEMEISYEERQLRVRVRDDGKGIDPKLLGDDGREKHYGLPGMRERAKLLGGKLAIYSRRDAGTEVELIIPATHAYTSSRSPRRSRLAKRLLRMSGVAKG